MASFGVLSFWKRALISALDFTSIQSPHSPDFWMDQFLELKIRIFQSPPIFQESYFLENS